MLYGQEKNGTIWGLCKLNMLFHDILDVQIENGDTLNEPKHREGAELKRFDIVIANPPFSQNYSTDSMKHKVKRPLSILDADQGQSGFHVCLSQMQSPPHPFGAPLRRRGIKKMSCESKFPSGGGVAGEA